MIELDTAKEFAESIAEMYLSGYTIEQIRVELKSSLGEMGMNLTDDDYIDNFIDMIISNPDLLQYVNDCESIRDGKEPIIKKREVTQSFSQKVYKWIKKNACPIAGALVGTVGGIVVLSFKKR